MSNTLLSKHANAGLTQLPVRADWSQVNEILRQRALSEVLPQLLRVGTGAAATGATIAGIRELMRSRAERKVQERERNVSGGSVRIFPKQAAVAADQPSPNLAEQVGRLGIQGVGISAGGAGGAMAGDALGTRIGRSAGILTELLLRRLGKRTGVVRGVNDLRRMRYQGGDIGSMVGTIGGAVAGGVGGNSVANRLLDPATTPKTAALNGIASGIGNFVSDVTNGTYAREPQHFPWFIPAAAATGLAAGVGGYKMTDGLLDRMRAKAKERELERAKRQYVQALTQYGKVSEERCKLAQDCDRIVAVLTSGNHKLSETAPGDAHRMMGLLAGLYLTAMGGAAGYGFTRGMKSQNSSSKTRAAERAQLERQLQQQRQLSPVITVAD